ncbi:MAG: type IV pilus assembly protein PilM [Candidatus Nealsonbacteria bacterium]
MISFLNLKPTAFGLDISDLSLKIIQLKKKGRFFDLASFGETTMKPGIINQGEVKNEKDLAESISKAVREAKGEKIKTKYAVISLPEEKAFLQVIQLPSMTEEEVKKAVYFEAENYIPLPIESVYLDSQIISYDRTANKLNVLIAAAPKIMIDPYLSSLKKAGLQPVVFEIESQAISRALVEKEMSKEPLLLVDMGANRTSFIIFSGCSLGFTSTAQVSSQQFTEAVSKSLKVGLKEAEELKIKHGIGGDKEGQKIFEILYPFLIDLITQIKKYLDYCKTHYNQEVKNILLCGGGAGTKGLIDFLSIYLKLPVKCGNPWTNILSDQTKEVKQLSHKESLRYTTAIGLALRGVNHD